jgi:autotransporter-associated beta strand protein
VGNGTTGTIAVTSGTHEISAGLALSGNVTKSGPGTLIISGAQAHTGGANLSVTQGQVSLNSNAGTAASGGGAAATSLAVSVSGSGSKVVLGSSQDLKDLVINTGDAGTQGVDLASPAGVGAFNALRVYSANLAATKAALNAAVGNARTNAGDGIFDSTIHAASAIGIAQIADAHGDSHVLVRPTKVGDLNLDGSVTISDFIDLASHFNGVGGWQEGDLNFDGSITISDFIDLASNFNTSYSGEVWPISGEDQQLLSNFAASIGASVPEPGTMGVAALGAFGLLGRRRRRAVDQMG